MPNNSPEDTHNSSASEESEAFKSAVRKLMQVPHQELKEKLVEAEAKKDDHASKSPPDEGDRPAEKS